MSGRSWWERDPGRLAHELTALRAARIGYAVDEEAQRLGVLRLRLDVDAGAERLRLVVTFPDLYPYFRFEVEAPDLSLAHHQNPFGKNLCLLPRGTHDWHTTDTVAGVLGSQLPKVLATGRSSDAEAARGIEQEQAEPLSEYYPCAESMIVLGGVPRLPRKCDQGTFRVATSAPQGPPPAVFAQGILSEISTGGGVLWREEQSRLAAWGGAPLQGLWLRTDAPILHDQHEPFLREMLRRFPFAAAAPGNNVAGGYLQIWGLTFPEEHRWRDAGGDGWVFFCLFSRERRGLASVDPRQTHESGTHTKGKKRKRNR